MRTFLRLLLHSWPRDFREEFGAGMLEIMLADYARARSQGSGRALLVLLATAVDALWTGLGERLDPTWVTTRTREDGRWLMAGTPEAWRKDFVHAARGLARTPGFTLVTVVTLALAIGSNTAIFSVVDAVLLDALPFPDADRLVAIRGSAPGTDLPEVFGVPDELYVQYQQNADLLEDVGLFGASQATMRTDERVDRLFMTQATASFFSTLGVTPELGRLPTDDDGPDVAVISHWLWATWFGSDPSVLGHAYEMSGTSRTVIGVMGPDFRFPDERVALWIHMVVDPTRLTAGDFGPNVVGRLAPGADLAGLTAQLTPLARRLPEIYGGSPQYARIMERHRPVVEPLREALLGGIAGPLWVLLGTVGIVLLIACANVANLFMVRAEGRRQDLAVRRALGAGRATLVRAQMAEALLLAALGGVGGALVAWAGVPALIRAAPEGIPRLASVALDPTALLFTAGASILAACAFGLLPAVRFSNPGLVGGLRQSGGSGAAARRRGRDALVVLQTASALVLLVASGLLVQSFWRLSRVDPGFDTQDIFTFQIAPTGEDLMDGPSYARFHYAFMERLAAMPGVESVGVVQELPLDEGAGRGFISTERTEVTGEEEPLVRVTFTGGDYFETMGIDLLSGRRFEHRDQADGVAEAIVSQAAADLLWPGEDPLGKHLRPSGVTSTWWTVVGVVEDVFLSDFREQAPEPLIYLPLVGPTADLYAVGSPAYVVRSPRAEVMAPEVRELVHQVAPDSPMYRVFTMRGLAARSMAQLSFTMLILGVASGLALILGAVGLYGVLSYVVSRRTREIGVRMALGAEVGQVRRMVVLQGGRVALVGLAVGLLGAVGLTRVLGTLLFGVGALDPATFVTMAALMLAVALLASYVPARRASSVDPMRSLRTE